MREKFIELPQGNMVLNSDRLFGPIRLKSGKVTGSRYFIEIDPNDYECAFVGRRKDGAYVGYQMAELSPGQLEEIRTKKQVDLLAREILNTPEEFYELADGVLDEESIRFLEEEQRDIEAGNRDLERQKERQLHPFKRRVPDERVRARHDRLWNYRNVKNGQLKLET